MMLKLFVILVFAAVVFGDNSSMSSLMTFAKLKSTTTMLTATTAASAPTATPTTTAASAPTAMPTTTAASAPTVTPTPTATSTAKAKKNSTAATTATPTTSTRASKTTTPHPTTSLKPTNTTTPPTTTTTALPTITPPAPGNFSLKENGTYCILAQFNASFNIQYDFTVDNSSFKNSTAEYLDSMHQDAVNISGGCGKNETEPSLVLSWPKKDPLYVLTMKFRRLDTASPSSNNTNMTSWMVHLITFKVTLKNNSKLNFPLALVNNKTSILGKYNGSPSFGGHIGGNYFCAHNTHLRFSLSSNVSQVNITSVFEHMRLEPFAAEKGALDFNKNDTTECYQDHPTAATVRPAPTKAPNDIVPIAVGCALAGLVLIVLIAYVIGRRKSHSGYEKV